MSRYKPTNAAGKSRRAFLKQLHCPPPHFLLPKSSSRELYQRKP